MNEDAVFFFPGKNNDFYLNLFKVICENFQKEASVTRYLFFFIDPVSFKPQGILYNYESIERADAVLDYSIIDPARFRRAQHIKIFTLSDVYEYRSIFSDEQKAAVIQQVKNNDATTIHDAVTQEKRRIGTVVPALIKGFNKLFHEDRLAAQKQESLQWRIYKDNALQKVSNGKAAGLFLWGSQADVFVTSIEKECLQNNIARMDLSDNLSPAEINRKYRPDLNKYCWVINYTKEKHAFLLDFMERIRNYTKNIIIVISDMSYDEFKKSLGNPDYLDGFFDRQINMEDQKKLGSLKQGGH